MTSTKLKPRRRRIESAFAKNLKQILDERAITVRGAAEIAGVNHAVIHAWLQGSQPHDPNAVLRLCRALRCDFQWLLTGAHSDSGSPGKNLSEIFEIQDEPAFSGVFMIEAKRLKKRE